MFQNVFKRAMNPRSTANVFQTFFMGNSGPNWTGSSYEQFCTQGYMRNVIAHRCIAMIARSASFINFKFGVISEEGKFIENTNHRLIDAFLRPNSEESFYDIMEKIYSYKLIWGNAFLLVKMNGDAIVGIRALRPDRITILTDENDELVGYRYKLKKYTTDFPIQGDGFCNIIHIKSFNPLNDHYGLSAMECAKYAIDQHNEASGYAKSLLQNSARPSGALVVKPTEYNNGGKLTREQFETLRNQLYQGHVGAVNSGKPLILEGGLDWKEMSISPREMDFIENKNMSAREIALAFGVPPHILGIPGDNTYSNLSESRIALWEHTIIPLIQDVTKTIERGFANILYDDGLIVRFDKKQIAEISKKEMPVE